MPASGQTFTKAFVIEPFVFFLLRLKNGQMDLDTREELSYMWGFHCTECGWAITREDGLTELELIESACKHTEKTHHPVVRTGR